MSRDFQREVTLGIDSCPACGGDILKHQPSTEDFNESWTYICRAEIVLDERKRFVQNECCHDALGLSLIGINDRAQKGRAKKLLAASEGEGK